jgi:acyl-homoserine lactone synthase
MFEDRRRLFVDLLRWEVPVVDGRFEIDEFDGDHAVYLIELDQLGAHTGSLRLLPSDRPHLLGSLFASLCADGVPAAPNTFEITRLCLPTRLGAAERLRVRNRLISAMVDYALEAGIKTLTGVVETSFLAQIMVMGWRCARLGPSRNIGQSWLGAFAIEIDADTRERLRATGIYQPRVPVAVEETADG